VTDIQGEFYAALSGALEGIDRHELNQLSLNEMIEAIDDLPRAWPS
jgi:hypothetical protein